MDAALVDLDQQASADIDRCLLAHRIFRLFGPPLFRRAASGAVTLMVVQLGEREIAMPLAAVRREFMLDQQGATQAAADGQMLDLVERALDYVTVIRPGDPLPTEVLSGQASWEVGPDHLRLAASRLRLQLVAWLQGDDAAVVDAAMLRRLDDDPGLRDFVQAALRSAAEALGLTDQDAVLGLLEDMTRELAHIEAMRDWLLGGVALRQLVMRFEEINAQTGEILATLRHADRQRDFVRAQRDWLYRSWRAWRPLLGDWQRTTPRHDIETWMLLNRSYQFLAPRFMQVMEWISLTRPAKTGREPAMMIW